MMLSLNICKGRQRLKTIIMLLFLVVGQVHGLTFNANQTARKPPVLLFLTDVSPPGEVLNQSNELTGPTIELIKIIQQRLNEHIRLKRVTWARAYQMALAKPNIVVFETLRNSVREPLFHWVGPLKFYSMALYGKPARINAQLDSQTMAKRYIACTQRGAAHANTIEQLGFVQNVNLVLTTKREQCTDLLLKNRVDLAVFNDLSAHKLVSSGQIKPFIPLGDIQLYLAFSSNVPEQRIRRWQMALEESYLDGTMRSLYLGYYPDSMIQRLELFAQRAKAMRNTQPVNTSEK